MERTGEGAARAREMEMAKMAKMERSVEECMLAGCGQNGYRAK
jgi:hypothetical protein